MTEPIVIAIAACLLGSYFAACHTALKSFSRKRLADLLQETGRSADRLDILADRRYGLIMITGLLRAVSGLIVALAMLWLFEDVFAGRPRVVAFTVAFIAAGLLVAVFNVALPLAWARYRPERLLAWSLPLLDILQRVFSPLTAVLSVIDPVVRRISGHDLEKGDDDIGGDVLNHLETHEQHEEIDIQQKQMLQAVFDLPKTTAGEVMTPRTEVDGLEISTDLDAIRAFILEVGHSRIPVYEESLDKIEGVLYAKDLIRYVGTGEPFDVRLVMRDPQFVPESKSVVELLAEFKQRQVHMAIVLDEYGGTAGLVTIEDILEELVGEIHDEYESERDDALIQTISEGVAEVDARVDIDDLADHIGFDVPDDADYDTVGGFVFAQLGHIPDEGEAFEHDSVRFTVIQAERTRINQVRVEKLAPDRATTSVA